MPYRRHCFAGLLASALLLSPFAAAGRDLSPDALAGRYFLSGVHEVGSELLLVRDGRFSWSLSHGGVEETVEGRWSIEGNAVALVAAEPPGGSGDFHLAGKVEWNKAAATALANRRQSEALQKLASACPLASLSDAVTPARLLPEEGEPRPSTAALAQAAAHMDAAYRAAQQALDGLKRRPDWQSDAMLVASADAAVSTARGRLARLRDLQSRAGTETVSPPALDYPLECRLPDWEREATAFRGVAVQISDLGRDGEQADGIRVEAQFDERPVVSDVVANGYAFFPLDEGQRIRSITLSMPGARPGEGITLPVDLAATSVQSVTADLSALETPAFMHLTLRVNEDGSLSPAGRPVGGAYRKVHSPAPRPEAWNDSTQSCAKAPTSGAAAEGSAMRQWQQELSRRLARAQRYPRDAVRQEIEGVVHLRLKVLRDGTLKSVEVERSSGNTLLDEAALETARRAQPLPSLPCDQPDGMTFVQPLHFILEH